MKRIPVYKTQENKDRIMAIYEKNLAGWVQPYESVYVPTRYGQTHVLTSGPQDAPPVVLIPGLAGTATMWLPNISAFSKHFRCYAVDLIGDYGRSELANPRKFITTGKGYSRWLCEVLDRLGLEKANVVGASNGGYVTLCQAIYAPERVEKIIPMAPAGLNLTTTDILPRIFSYLFFPSEEKRERLIKWFIGEHPKVMEAFYDLMVYALQGFPRVPIPIILSARKMKKIKTPSLFILGEKDPAIPAYQVKPRIGKYIPHAQVEIIPNVGHVLNIEAAELVDELVVRFLGG